MGNYWPSSDFAKVQRKPKSGLALGFAAQLDAVAASTRYGKMPLCGEVGERFKSHDWKLPLLATGRRDTLPPHERTELGTEMQH